MDNGIAVNPGNPFDTADAGPFAKHPYRLRLPFDIQLVGHISS